jgi:hypothetical protein
MQSGATCVREICALSVQVLFSCYVGKDMKRTWVITFPREREQWKNPLVRIAQKKNSAIEYVFALEHRRFFLIASCRNDYFFLIRMSIVSFV